MMEQSTGANDPTKGGNFVYRPVCDQFGPDHTRKIDTGGYFVSSFDDDEILKRGISLISMTADRECCTFEPRDGSVFCFQMLNPVFLTED